MAEDVQALTSEERARMVERHERHPRWGHCRECGKSWPCPEVRWEATCAALEAEIEAYRRDAIQDVGDMCLTEGQAGDSSLPAGAQ